MRILRRFPFGVTTVALALSVGTVVGRAQVKSGSDMGGSRGNMMGSHDKAMMTGNASRGTMTKEQKIANAMSAGPMSVADKATVLDWPAKEGDQPAVLRTGTNGWTCLPDMPQTQGNDPMCLDKSWMAWVDAYLAHKPVQISTLGSNQDVSSIVPALRKVSSGSDSIVLPARLDAGMPANTVRVPAAHPDTAALGAMFGTIEVVKA